MIQYGGYVSKLLRGAVDFHMSTMEEERTKTRRRLEGQTFFGPVSSLMSLDILTLQDGAGPASKTKKPSNHEKHCTSIFSIQVCPEFQD